MDTHFISLEKINLIRLLQAQPGHIWRTFLLVKRYIRMPRLYPSTTPQQPLGR
jgi:hypothetical protein